MSLISFDSGHRGVLHGSASVALVLLARLGALPDPDVRRPRRARIWHMVQASVCRAADAAAHHQRTSVFPPCRLEVWCLTMLFHTGRHDLLIQRTESRTNRCFGRVLLLHPDSHLGSAGHAHRPNPHAQELWLACEHRCLAQPAHDLHHHGRCRALCAKLHRGQGRVWIRPSTYREDGVHALAVVRQGQRDYADGVRVWRRDDLPRVHG